MKHPKPEAYKWIHEQLVLRCEQLGIEEIPKLVFSRKDVLAMPLEHTAGRRTSTHRYLGICYREARTIFLNIRSKYVKRLKGRRSGSLEETMVHELVHYRFGYLGHGRKFEDRVKKIFEGKTYPK